MFLGLGIRDRDQNFTTCWGELQLGFKTLMIIQIIAGILFIIFPSFAAFLPNFINQTVEKFQVWRVFTSFLVHGHTIRVFINILFNIYILYISMPDIEKRFSTAYVTMEILLKVIFSNILLVCIGYPLIYLFGMDPDYVSGYGLTPVIFTFMWHKVSQTPQEPTRFCWFPCNIPMKFVPWCYFLIEIFFSNPFLSIIIYSLLGYYEFMLRKKRILRLPLSVYKKMDSWMAQGILNRVGYVKVVKVEEELRTLCSVASNEQQQRNERVEVLGTGVSIGGSNVNPINEKEMKSYWQKKAEEFQMQSIKQEIIQRDNKEEQQRKRQLEQQRKQQMEGCEQQREQQQPQFQQFQSETIAVHESSDFDQKSVKSDKPLLIASEQPSKQECDQDYT